MNFCGKNSGILLFTNFAKQVVIPKALDTAPLESWDFINCLQTSSWYYNKHPSGCEQSPSVIHCATAAFHTSKMAVHQDKKITSLATDSWQDPGKTRCCKILARLICMNHA